MTDMIRKLEPDDQGRFWIDDDDTRTLIKDPWNTRSGILESPRFPPEQAVWRPFAFARKTTVEWEVYIHHWLLPWVTAWTIDRSGAPISQRVTSREEALALIRQGLFTGNVGFASLLLGAGDHRAARRAAIASTTSSFSDDAGLEFLVAQYASEGRHVAARRLLSRLTRLRKKRRRSTWFEPSQEKGLFDEGFAKSCRKASILYLLQGPTRLSQEMEAALEACDSEFICLTFRENVFDSRYTFVPGSTWTQGRNELYAIARRLPLQYDYYVFCDGDFSFTGESLSAGLTRFNRELLEQRPEIGVPANSWHPTWGSQYDPQTPTTRAWGFDAMFNAFSKDVVSDGILFPYTEAFDSTNWHMSQLVLVGLASIYYDAVQFNTIDVANDQHDNYPQHDVNPLVVSMFTRILTAHDSVFECSAPHALKRLRRQLFNKPLRDSMQRTSIMSILP